MAGISNSDVAHYLLPKLNPKLKGVVFYLKKD